MSAAEIDKKLTTPMHPKLLEPGWAGLLTYEEAVYIQEHLFADPRLRRRWKYRGKRPSLVAIARRAFPEAPDIAAQHIRRQQNKIRQRQRRCHVPAA